MAATRLGGCTRGRSDAVGRYREHEAPPRASARTPNFAPDGSRRPAETLVRTAVSVYLLARRRSPQRLFDCRSRSRRDARPGSRRHPLPDGPRSVWPPGAPTQSSGLRSPSCSSVPNLSTPSTVVVASTAPSSRHIRPSNWHWSRPAGTAARSTSVGSMEGGPFLADLTVVVGFGCSGPQSRARAPPVTAAHDCLSQHTGAGSDGTLPPPPTASQGTPVAPHASMAMVERPRVAGQARHPRLGGRGRRGDPELHRASLLTASCHDISSHHQHTAAQSRAGAPAKRHLRPGSRKRYVGRARNTGARRGADHHSTNLVGNDAAQARIDKLLLQHNGVKIETDQTGNERPHAKLRVVATGQHDPPVLITGLRAAVLRRQPPLYQTLIYAPTTR